MAIQTSIAPRQKWWTITYFVLCLGFGLWGLYDYLVTIPRREVEAREFQQAQTRLKEIEALAVEQGELTEAQRTELAAVSARIDEFGGDVPQPPRAWDRPVQLWLYVVGCGLIGAPWFAWTLWSTSRKKYTLNDDGSLDSPEGHWSRDDIVGIDMNRWMEKSMAWVIHRDGRRLLLDDYKYRNMHLIVGALAHRFDPASWTIEAKVVKPADDDAPGDDDTPDADVDPVMERATSPDHV